MKKTTIAFFVAGLSMISGLKAQSIPEGVNHLYAERIKSAIDVFTKMLATNPNNIEATYWLGQSYLEVDEIASARIASARQLYEKALLSSNNAPLLLVGMGHVELRENKISEARQHFETALTLTRTKKGDDPAILNAIGRANAEGKAGDYNYAIEKLMAAADKGEKNAETFLQLGNAYRKAKPGEGGGDAYKSYKKALEINPSFAVADLRLAKLFESQKNWELFLEYLNDAIKRDPKYSPAYFEMFYYYFFRGKFPEAEEQLKKYTDSKLPETDIQDEYLNAQLCWARKDFDCAVLRAEKVVLSLGELTKPKVYRLLADAYYQKGDFPNAKKYSDVFFAKKNPDDINSFDYKIKADVLSKTGGSAEDIYNAYWQGASLDSVLTSRIDFLKQGAEFFKSRGDSISRNKEGDLRLALIKLKTNPGQRDYFDAGFAFYQGKNYSRSDSLYSVYTEKYPGETFGWQMRFQISRILDSTMEKGLAVPFGIKYLEVLEKDTAKNKSSILSTAGYLAQYYANILKDKVKAVEYFRKMQLLNPGNTDIQKYIDLLEGKTPPRSTKPNGNAPPAKPVVPKPLSVAKSKSTAITKKAVVKK